MNTLEFLRAENLPLIANTDIIDLNELGDDTVLLGYILGGIVSEQPNVFFNNQDLSAASPTLFAVNYVPDDNSTAIKSVFKIIFSDNMIRIFQPDKALFADVMGLITAKKRNEVWLGKTIILAKNIILNTL